MNTFSHDQSLYQSKILHRNTSYLKKGNSVQFKEGSSIEVIWNLTAALTIEVLPS